MLILCMLLADSPYRLLLKGLIAFIGVLRRSNSRAQLFSHWSNCSSVIKMHGCSSQTIFCYFELFCIDIMLQTHLGKQREDSTYSTTSSVPLKGILRALIADTQPRLQKDSSVTCEITFSNWIFVGFFPACHKNFGNRYSHICRLSNHVHFEADTLEQHTDAFHGRFNRPVSFICCL